GLGQGQQKLGYLPYAYSDFIFSTIGEEWGFLGVLALLVLFGTFVWLGFRITRSARDSFGQLLAVGLTALIGITAALHVGVTLAQALRDAGKGVEPVLVGAARGIEAQVLPRYPFRHRLLPIEPLYRRTWWKNLRWLLIAGRVWRAVGRVIDEERPAIVIGTGGYAAGPVVWRAQRAGLPTVLVEENAFPGLTTRWLARRARQIHLGFPEARARLRVGTATQVFTLGNPVRPPEPGAPATALAQPGL